ncbi:MAG: PSD1 and planctomycete cytochrome C domain-containing protein [Pirellulaceae bacterium]
MLLVATAVGKSSALDFTRDVLPILEQRCFRCHEGREPQAGRRLDQRREWLATDGGEPLATPGNHHDSRVIALVSASDPDNVMPPEGPRLSEAEIGVLSKWIDAGLPWDLSRLPDDDEARHWAFQPIRRPKIPSDASDPAIFNAVDSFVVAKYRDEDVQPAPLADRRTLIRRLCLNLIGLPPSFAEVEAFIQDNRPDAYLRLVDRLLSSPQYGERWGRHWLDVARWAESEGYESNHPRPSAWRYRDYAVNSFNQEKPFDEFIQQQIAGDELENYSHENFIATGFLAAARISSNEEDKWRQRNDVNVDIVNAVGNALLGMTIQCAQCHDHKFDPITIRDYYQLQAFFVRGQPVAVRLNDSGSGDATSQALRQWNASYEAARRRLIAEESKTLSPAERAALLKQSDQRSVEEELLARRADMQIPNSRSNIERHITPDDRTAFNDRKKRIDTLCVELPQTFAFYSPLNSPHPIDVIPSIGFYPLPYDEESFARARPYVMRRGDVHSLGAPVHADWPAFLRATSPSAEARHESRTRTDLAKWLTDRSNPLVARVWVNRIWQYHFGQGLVATAEDFGTRGARPSHPKLLDWLATELIDSDWSTRHIQRLIVTSRTFRLASSPAPSAREHDPDNTYLTRWTPRRLEVEAIRDSWLAISGQLDLQVGGPSVVEEGREISRRRSIYLFQRRGKPPAMLSLFDGPNECVASLGQRSVSTSPLQTLYLLNSEFVVRQARLLAELVERESGGDVAVAVAWAFRRTVQRAPTPSELVSSLRLIETLEHNGSGDEAAGNADSPPTAMTLFCQALLNLSDVYYVE